MTTPIKAAFELQGVMVQLDQLLPTRQLPKGLKQTKTYKTVLASIREVGVLEPLSVYPHKGGKKYLLLHGHVRVEALRELGITETLCLVATSIENYTYNRYVCAVPPIQMHRMIEKAIEAGLSEERIARALNRTVGTIRRNRTLLRDICPEAVEILKDKPVAIETISLLKRVKPMRQMAIAEMMRSTGTYSATYARGLLVTTKKDQLVDPTNQKKIRGVKPEDLARMEHELQALEQNFRLLDETYNENIMSLTIARGYLRQLLDNNRVVRYLAQKRSELLAEFQRIVEATALDG